MALQVLKFGADVVAPAGAIVPGAFPSGIAKQKTKRKRPEQVDQTSPLFIVPGWPKIQCSKKGCLFKQPGNAKPSARKGVRALSKIIALKKACQITKRSAAHNK